MTLLMLNLILSFHFTYIQHCTIPIRKCKYLIPSAIGRFLYSLQIFRGGIHFYPPPKNTLGIAQGNDTQMIAFEIHLCCSTDCNHGLKGTGCKAKIFHWYFWWCTLIRVWMWWVHAGYAMKNIAYTFWVLPILSFTDANEGTIIIICTSFRIYKYKQLLRDMPEFVWAWLSLPSNL